MHNTNMALKKQVYVYIVRDKPVMNAADVDTSSDAHTRCIFSSAAASSDNSLHAANADVLEEDTRDSVLVVACQHHVGPIGPIDRLFFGR